MRVHNLIAAYLTSVDARPCGDITRVVKSVELHVMHGLMDELLIVKKCHTSPF